MMKAKVAEKAALLPIKGSLTKLVLTNLGSLSPPRSQFLINKTFQMIAVRLVFHMMNISSMQKRNIWLQGQETNRRLTLPVQAKMISPNQMKVPFQCVIGLMREGAFQVWSQ